MVLETWFSDFKVSELVEKGNPSSSEGGPGPRWAHTFNALYELGEAHVIGGIRSANDLSALDDRTYCLNLTTLKWEAIVCAAAAAGGGGGGNDEEEDKCTTSCTRRAFHTTTQISDYELLVFGGWTGAKERCNTLGVFNALKRSWSMPSIEGSVRPEPRQGHSAAKINAADVAVYGGWSGGAFCDSLYILDTVTWSWSKVETVGIPPCLADHNCYMTQWWLIFNGGFGMEGENAMTHSLDLVTKEWDERTESGDNCLLDIALDRITGVGQSELSVGSSLVRFGGCDVNSGLYEDRNYSNVLEVRSVLNFAKASTSNDAKDDGVTISDIKYGPLEVDSIAPRAYHTCIQASKHCILAYGGRDKTQAFGDLWAIMLPEKLVLDQQANPAPSPNSTEAESLKLLHEGRFKVHPSLLRGLAKEERIIEREVARSQISDLVYDLRNSVADKDTSLKLEQVTCKGKIEWLKEQIENVKSDLEQLHEYKRSLEKI